MLPDLAEQFDAERAEAHLRALTAPQMGGRWPGSAGERRAADYVEAVLHSVGATPFAGRGGYSDPFDVVVPEFRGQPSLAVDGSAGPSNFEYLQDFGVNVQGAAGAGSADAETVWVGTGRSELGGAATRGRVAVVGVGKPSPKATVSDALESYLDLHRRLRDAGALAVLRTGHVRGVRKAMSHLREEPSLPSLDVTPDVIRAAFGRHPPGAIGTVGRRVRLEVPLVHRTVSSAGNVVGSLGVGSAPLLVMAHYDHLGTLPDGRYFAGASDNAAGVAVVLEVARVLAAWRREMDRHVVVLLTTAEEVGLAGAAEFVREHRGCVRSLEAAVNVDEVGGRRADGMDWLCSEDFPQERRPVQPGCAHHPLVRLHRLRLDGFSDLSPFVAAGMTRVAAVFARSHREQLAHTLGDTPERIETAQLRAVGRCVLRVLTASDR